MKTSELIGPALDWAVAKCEGYNNIYRDITKFKNRTSGIWLPDHPYSTNWVYGGPIIEREEITVAISDLTGKEKWCAYRLSHLFEEGYDHEYQHGPTPLIAGMRCYVTSKFGDEIKIPQELL